MTADVAVVESVQSRILLHILCSRTNSLIIGDRLEEYLGERGLTCDFVRSELDEGLEHLIHSGQLVFQRTDYGAKEYRHTDQGRDAAAQLLSDCGTEWQVQSLWDPVT